MSMILKSISMYRYGDNEHFSGSLTFDSETGKIELKLTPVLSDKVVAACAEELVAQARAAAEAMTASVFTQASQLPAIQAPKPSDEIPF